MKNLICYDMLNAVVIFGATCISVPFAISLNIVVFQAIYQLCKQMSNL